MECKRMQGALALLQRQFSSLDWACSKLPGACPRRIYHFPGRAEEDVILTVHKSGGTQEPFHRHDFFFFNYTYRGQYDSLSQKYDRLITIKERELYAGQPFAGHALCVHDDKSTVIIGVLIRKEAFYRSFLPLLNAGTRLLHFFLDPATDSFSEEYLHFPVDNNSGLRMLLELMVMEYAEQKPDVQDVLRSLTMTFLMLLARQCSAGKSASPAEEIVDFMDRHLDTVDLQMLAAQFSYHPNYLSALLRRATGRSFSQLRLELRMARAAVLLRGTTLPNDRIAAMLGYPSTSNFYKAFRSHYGASPKSFRKAPEA